MSLGPIVLPFRAEQYSFALTYRASPEEQANIDWSCVAFDINGTIKDVVYSRKPTALDNALARSTETLALPENTFQVDGDEVIHMFPKDFNREVEVLMFVAGAPRTPGKANDLSCSSQLTFGVTYTAENGERFHHSAEMKAHTATGLSYDPQLPPEKWMGTMIVAIMYLTEHGWTLRTIGTTHNEDSLGHIIPDLKRTILGLKHGDGVVLDAADRLSVIENEKKAYTRQWEDRSLGDAASVREPAPVSVSKMRIDLSWTFWPPQDVPEGEDPPEDPAVEFNLIMYNKDGEEVQSISTSSREAPGCRAGRPEPEEEEEAEPEPEPEAEEGEEGEEGAEGAEPAEPPAPPPAPKVDPYEFKERDVAYIDLAELPAEVRSIILVVSQYDTERGWEPVRSVTARLMDVSAGEENPRCLADFGVLSPYGMQKNLTQVLLLKLYKEYKDGAFALFGGASASDLTAYLAQDVEDLKTALKSYLETAKKAKAAEAAAAAAAEESGEEVKGDARDHEWRFRSLGLVLGGESLEAVEHDVKNALTYDGVLVAGASRTTETARVQFANNDTYFGGYVDDLKEGPGMYTFASGAAYAGHYKAGKRDGSGVMVFPDGGTYEGHFVADKFEGQGQYRYPDGSVYSGSWKAGLKDGSGVYWDTEQGCLRGEWAKGVLKGDVSYDQPAYHYQGEFVRGVPAGAATFTVCSHRTLDMPKFAAAHIQAEGGPMLSLQCSYSIPAGSGDEPTLDEEGQEVEDPDKAKLPAFPKYEGLTFTSEVLPGPAPDLVFPPIEGLPVPLLAVPSFTVSEGLVH